MTDLTPTKIRIAFGDNLPPTALEWWNGCAPDIQNEMIILAQREGVEKACNFMIDESYFQKLDQDDSPLHEREHPNWEFDPEFKKDVMPHLEDWSWHNDTKPCFVDSDTGLTIWADHLDESQRQFPGGHIYTLWQADGLPRGWEHPDNPEILLETDDLSEVKQVIDTRRAKAGVPRIFLTRAALHEEEMVYILQLLNDRLDLLLERRFDTTAPDWDDADEKRLCEMAIENISKKEVTS